MTNSYLAERVPIQGPLIPAMGQRVGVGVSDGGGRQESGFRVGLERAVAFSNDASGLGGHGRGWGRGPCYWWVYGQVSDTRVAQ